MIKPMNPRLHRVRRARAMCRAGISEIELLIAILIVAVLVALLGPWFRPNVAIKGPKTKALSNAKQVALALRIYAADHNGVYPSWTLSGGTPSSTSVVDSNTAFAQLFPTYVQSESIFWQTYSARCNPTPPDEKTDVTPLDTPVETLKQGENEWAYVLGLNDTSNPAVPLLANGFADPVRHTYTTDQVAPGGVWKGVDAVVIFADNSGRVMKVDPKTMMVSGTDAAVRTMGDIFTTRYSAKGWLGPKNAVVNPK